MKEENGKLKEEQLRAAAAAAEAEAARLAQLAAQNQAHTAQIEQLQQEMETLRARLEQKSAQIQRLEKARDEAAQGYCTPQSTPRLSSTWSLNLSPRLEKRSTTLKVPVIMKLNVEFIRNPGGRSSTWPSSA